MKPQPRGPAIALWCALAIALAGCATPDRLSMDLMPAPDAFNGGAINPLPDHNPVVDLPYGGILYATDRLPAVAGGKEPYYQSARGQVLRLGVAKLELGNTTMTWEEARRISLLKNRPGNYPIKLTGITEFGVLDRTLTPLVDPGETPADSRAAGKTFAAAIDDKLKRSATKDVFIYVHGYKVTFENPVLVASELWHFLGYQGVFIAYSWPATPKATAYVGDVDTSAGMARNLRELIGFIEANTDAERIHVIGYSAGTRLVARALEQMALINRGHEKDPRRLGARLSNVLLVSSDIDRNVFGAYLADGILSVPAHLTVYASDRDSALEISRALTGHARLGTMWKPGELTPSATRFLATERDRLSFVDVSGAENITSGGGHDYFRASPWVSSDVLIALAYRLKPENRGLVRDPATGIAAFPPDYVSRMRAVLETKYSLPRSEQLPK